MVNELLSYNSMHSYLLGSEYFMLVLNAGKRLNKFVIRVFIDAHVQWLEELACFIVNIDLLQEIKCYESNESNERSWILNVV